jgi:predicted site-specific integrase-resolvase
MEDMMVFLNPKQLAQRWHTSAKTLERWRNRGTGPVFLKICGKVLYALAEVERIEQDRSRIASRRSPRARTAECPETGG